MNATKPYEYGGYYAWGEVNQRPITTYYQENYAYYDEISEGSKFIGYDISGTEYDAARKNWGDSWKMPTVQDFKELCEFCPSVPAEMKGIKGHLFVSTKNDKVIFLPAAGSIAGNKYEGSHLEEGNGGLYWSSTYCTENNDWTVFSYELGFGWGIGGTSSTGFYMRCSALPIRAVK